jgi:alkylation response protein AidB-like acyl-CoA dehydrogenase
MSTVVPATPRILNTWDVDHALQRMLTQRLSAGAMAHLVPRASLLGRLAGGELFDLAREAELNPPIHRAYDVYGARVDRIVTSHAWNRITDIGVQHGIVGSGHDPSLGAEARLVQLALLHVFSPSSAFVMCPMAMTDGAATLLTPYRDDPRFDNAVRRLTSNEPSFAWSSGQWMTEIEGGSDVSRTSTRAVADADGWRLYGTKFFTSATTANCTLALARPEGAPPGSKGLSLFYLEPWRADGTANDMRVRRLKEKLGTRAMPTAELELDGTLAWAVGGIGDGVRKITRVLNIARYYNTIGAVSIMGRAHQMALAFARLRTAFGSPLIQLPLHVETLANMQVQYEGALAISVRLAELLGKVEHDQATEHERAVWRILTPLAKLGTARDCVAVVSEGLEACGGSGYMEDSGLPVLLRDAQVLPIWEGTTNVLSLDMLRASARDGAMEALFVELQQIVDGSDSPVLSAAVTSVRQALKALRDAAEVIAGEPNEVVQSAARAMALSLYRTYAAALLCEHARLNASGQDAARSVAIARRYTERSLLEPFGHNAARLTESAGLL